MLVTAAELALLYAAVAREANLPASKDSDTLVPTVSDKAIKPTTIIEAAKPPILWFHQL